MDQAGLPDTFEPLLAGSGGIDSWLLPDVIKPEVEGRLLDLPSSPLTRVQLNQLLVLSNEAGVSEGFFRYYWLSTPEHTYDVTKLPRYDSAGLETEIKGEAITSLDHLYWGLYRLYIDGLLYFGNVRTAYRALCDLSEDKLKEAFGKHRYNTETLQERGPPLALQLIGAGDRYLIGELACKTLEVSPEETSGFVRVFRWAFARHQQVNGDTTTTWKRLLADPDLGVEFPDLTDPAKFVTSEFLDEIVSSEADIDERGAWIQQKWLAVRTAALANTDYYLSMVEDLDAYVATSMRERDQFLTMAATCEELFSDPRLARLHLRYFDPTLSAADSHEDKGLIECLMVKCAKVLIYVADARDSYGKDAEAAMALSLGKPVIFLCDKGERLSFLRDVHPLSRLIHFDTGVAVGGIAVDSIENAAELLRRIFTNDMQYSVERPKLGRLRLKEQLTGSIVRLQTGNELLTTTFWNYYHKQPKGPLGLAKPQPPL